jgi:hypothetical protein
MIIENEKSDCAQSIAFGLHRGAKWRDKISERYSDPHAAWAAGALRKLADDAPSLTDDQWERLKPHYDFGSERWREAISLAARQVGFLHRTKSFVFFIKNLIAVLSQPAAVN